MSTRKHLDALLAKRALAKRRLGRFNPCSSQDRAAKPPNSPENNGPLRVTSVVDLNGIAELNASTRKNTLSE
jgi:hypothetical protein